MDNSTVASRSIARSIINQPIYDISNVGPCPTEEEVVQYEKKRLADSIWHRPLFQKK